MCLVDLAFQASVLRFRHRLPLPRRVQFRRDPVEIGLRRRDALVAVALDLAIQLQLLILQVLVLRFAAWNLALASASRLASPPLIRSCFCCM